MVLPGWESATEEGWPVLVFQNRSPSFEQVNTSLPSGLNKAWTTVLPYFIGATGVPSDAFQRCAVSISALKMHFPSGL